MEEKILICSICEKKVVLSKKKGNIGKVCYRCRQKYRQIKLKQKAIAYKGGKCQICGYDKCTDALDFHHRNPEEKEFLISCKFNMSWDNIKRELDKCDMICANCHREIHSKEHLKVPIEEYEKYITPITPEILNKREETKKKNKEKSQKNQENKIEIIKARKKIVENSEIDFSAFGWGNKLSKEFNISSAATVRWIKKHMPAFYKENCYREKDIDEIDINAIIDMYNSGKPVHKIASDLKIDMGRVSLILKNNGININIKNSKIVNMINIETKEVVETFNSISEAAVYCENNMTTTRSKNPLHDSIKKKIRNCVNGHAKTAYGYIWQEAS